jgi:uncharacterized small protein (DUF1192 family)
MSNLIKRLRDGLTLYSLNNEAADEIERLKAELFTMRNVFHQQDAEIKRLRERESMCHERALEQEIERLRAALERIANLPPGHICDAREIAREALTRD